MSVRLRSLITVALRRAIFVLLFIALPVGAIVWGPPGAGAEACATCTDGGIGCCHCFVLDEDWGSSCYSWCMNGDICCFEGESVCRHHGNCGCWL